MNYLIDSIDDQANYSVSYRSTTNPDKPERESNRRNFGHRRGKSPVCFNGIHRRRRKKIRW
jgi:hypothetical protein